MPFVTKGILREFEIEALSRGRLYSSGNGEICTVFHTRLGGVFTGDAVLYLSETPCRKLYFLGSCGLLQRTQGLKIGSIVSPSHCYAQESFTSLLSNPASPGILTTPDSILYRVLINSGGKGEIKEVIGISSGSLKMQPEKRGEWQKRGVQVVDLESAAFFAAARHIELSAAALMVVSDIVEVRPWYQENARGIISGSLQRAARILCEIISKKQSD
jgi:nucleoside phosphorylase